MGAVQCFEFASGTGFLLLFVSFCACLSLASVVFRVPLCLFGRSHYGLQSMFWCDLSSVGVSFEAVGLLDSKLDSVGVWSLKDPPQFTKFRGSFSRHPFDAGVVW